jgi:putative NADH-flavin reductase
LLSSNQPKFNVTAVARSSSTYEGPEALNVVKVDFNNHADLVQAMKGQDALILTISASPELAPTSIKLIDAAVEAGVKLIIPSEFGT